MQDGLLSAGYLDLIRRIYDAIPRVSFDGRRLQMIVCSATLHNFEVKKLADSLMHYPTWIDLKGEDAVPDTVHHVVVMVDPSTDREWIRKQTAHIQVGAIWCAEFEKKSD